MDQKGMTVSSRPLQQFVEQVAASRNAGSKAVRDVTTILTRMGFDRIDIFRWTSTKPLAAFFGRLSWVAHCPFWRRQIKQNACLVVQFTVSCFHGQLTFRLIDEDFKRRRNLQLIAVVHDLNRSDPMNDVITAVERRFFALCDKVIVHNDKMRDFLVRHGVESEKLVCLHAFDYLIDGSVPETRKDDPHTIAIAGNLCADKCGYLKALADVANVRWKLFGASVDESILADNVRYCGGFEPDHPPMELAGGFGLVWDGESGETCRGMFGEYLRVNNPHKMSLYLAVGVPVVVWRQAAVASFVTQSGVGLVVDSLDELTGRLRALTDADYARLCSAAKRIAVKLRSGGFMRAAVKTCLESLNQTLTVESDDPTSRCFADSGCSCGTRRQ